VDGALRVLGELDEPREPEPAALRLGSYVQALDGAAPPAEEVRERVLARARPSPVCPLHRRRGVAAQAEATTVQGTIRRPLTSPAAT
jgi:hypothetical protein